MLMRLFISFEGPEGSGKTTHTELLSEYLSEKGYDINLTREPGGTSLGEQIRELLLDPDHEDMDARSELFLYLAARAQHVTERIKPALEKGDVVICDRFTDASLVYQGIGRQLGFERVNELNEWATEQLRPDLTFILDVPVDRGLEEARRSSQTRWNTSDGDRMEQETSGFHERIRNGYQELAERFPDRCSLLSREAPIEDVQETIRKRVDRWIENHESQPTV
jgi:dTMP kinase